MNLRIFGWSYAVTAVSLVVAYLYAGIEGLILCAILGILEISLSFDNAVVNATVLDRMSAFWQRIFLTVGILIAVFGMRLVFPLVIVAVTAGLSPVESLTLALEQRPPDDPTSYAYLLDQAYPQIAAFGGMFLFMLFLDWIFEDRDITWLSWLERPLAKIGQLSRLAVLLAIVVLVMLANFLAEDPGLVLTAGCLGVVTYLLVNGLGDLFEQAGGDDEEESAEPAPVATADRAAVDGSAADGAAVDRAAVDGAAVDGAAVDGAAVDGAAVAGAAVAGAGAGKAAVDGAQPRDGGPSELAKASGKAGFFLFLYLEVLDAAFSFDGVIGAFAITTDPILIALGLGLIGAMFVRSLTVFLVRKGTLADYVYLEHGAHWAIGALAVILLVGIGYHVNEIVTGLIGVGFIGAAFLSSVLRNRRLVAEGAQVRKSAKELSSEHHHHHHHSGV
jgi:uncharacterized protein